VASRVAGLIEGVLGVPAKRRLLASARRELVGFCGNSHPIKQLKWQGVSLKPAGHQSAPRGISNPVGASAVGKSGCRRIGIGSSGNDRAWAPGDGVVSWLIVVSYSRLDPVN
jgi:hypothetical protein